MHGNQRGRPQPIDAGAVLQRLWTPKAKRIFFSTLFLCGIGLWLGFMAPSPVTITPSQQANYEKSLTRAQHVEGYYDAQADLKHAEDVMADTKVWFWRFRKDYRERVELHQPVLDAAVARFKRKQEERYQLIRAAKAEVGIWSPYGVEEVREQFWQTFQEGKDMAKRMTFYDVMFSMFDRREENAGAYIAKWVLRVLSNYTIGMVIAIIRFLFQLGSIIWSYSPNFLSGGLFFAVAAFGAISVVGIFLVLLYTSCLGCCFCMAQQARQQRQHAHYAPPRRVTHQHYQ